MNDLLNMRDEEEKHSDENDGDDNFFGSFERKPKATLQITKNN